MQKGKFFEISLEVPEYLTRKVGGKEGSVDGWILVLRRYLQRTQAKAIPDDRASSIISHLEV